MKLLSRVCADFTDRKGNVIYRIRPADRLVYKDDVPEEIRDDVLFQMLLADGSIEVIETADQRRKLESDPMAGADVTGKKETPGVKPEGKSGTKEADKPAGSKAAGGEKK